MAEKPFTSRFVVTKELETEEDGSEVEVDVERYELVKLLGEGGMAKVYFAIDHQTGTPVAIKFPKSEMYKNPEIIRRFRRETDVISRLQHPRIVQFLDWGVDESIDEKTNKPANELFLVMEYFDGEELFTFINYCIMEQEGRPIKGSLLSFSDIESVTLQTLEALHVVHSSGYVHRDLKPQNIMCRRENDGLVVKLTDFGIVKVLKGLGPDTIAKSGTLTQENCVVGTPTYLPPEQVWHGYSVDARADLFALGAIVYEMVTGRTTVEGIGDYVQIFSSLHPDKPFEEIRYPSKFVEEGTMNPALEEWILKLLKRNPDERFQTALEAAQQFRNIVAFQEGTPLGVQKPKPTHMSLRPTAIWERPKAASRVERYVALIALVVIAIGAPAAALYFTQDSAATGEAPVIVASAQESPEQSAKVVVPQPTASASAEPVTGLAVDDLPEQDRVRFQKVVQQMKALRPRTKCPRSVKRELLYFDATYPKLADVKHWIAVCFDREFQFENAELYHEQYRTLSGGLEKPP
jgi:serine/threonine protein kinase